MPKMKSNKAARSRFALTGSGQLKRSCQGKRHKLTKKSSLTKRRLSGSPIMDDSQVKMYKRMMMV
ncbi:MAG: 50S ribosomal protein L35 [Victivallaceae bacterium]